MAKPTGALRGALVVGAVAALLAGVANVFVSGFYHDWTELDDPRFWIKTAIASGSAALIVTLVIWADRSNRE